MNHGVAEATPRVRREPEYEFTVTAVAHRAPYHELTVSCPSLLGASAEPLWPTVWVRLWIPEGDRKYQRAYTLTGINQADASCQILVAQHSPDGPASRWVRTAEPGTIISGQLMGGTRYQPPVEEDRMLLVGDLASAPAIADAVAAAPASSQAQVVLLAHPQGYLPRASRDHELVLIDPEAPTADVMAAIDEAVHALNGPTWSWIALESALTRGVRRHLLDAGLARRSIQHQAYWILGRAMGGSSAPGA